MNYISKTHK